MAVPVFWRNDQFRQTLSQRLLARPSENGGCLSVPIRDDARGVDGDQRIQRGFHDRAVALLASAPRGCARPRAFLLDLRIPRAGRGGPEQQKYHGNQTTAPVIPTFHKIEVIGSRMRSRSIRTSTCQPSPGSRQTLSCVRSPSRPDARYLPRRLPHRRTEEFSTQADLIADDRTVPVQEIRIHEDHSSDVTIWNATPPANSCRDSSERTVLVVTQASTSPRGS